MISDEALEVSTKKCATKGMPLSSRGALILQEDQQGGLST